MHYAKLVAALVAANLVAIGTVSCSVKEKTDRELEIENPAPVKEQKKNSGWFS